MNKAFSEYTRSCAFTMTLSIRQVQALHWLSVVDSIPVGSRPSALYGIAASSAFCATLQTLKRKGLCFWVEGEGIKTHGPYLTKAGRLMVQVLVEAGYDEYQEFKEDAEAGINLQPETGN